MGAASSEGVRRRSLEPVEQPAGGDVERVEQSQQRGQPDLAYSAFDPADLDRGEAALLGEVLLCPAALEACLAHPRAELLQRCGHRSAIVEALSRTGQNQSGKVATMVPPMSSEKQ